MRTEVSTVPTARGLSCLDLLDRDLGPFELVLILALLKVNTTMNTVNLNGNPRLEARPFLTALLALEHIKMLGDLKAFPLRQVAQSNTREMQLEKVTDCARARARGPYCTAPLQFWLYRLGFCLC